MPRNKPSVQKTANIQKDRQCTLKRVHKTAFALKKQQVLYISVRARECVRTRALVCALRACSLNFQHVRSRHIATCGLSSFTTFFDTIFKNRYRM
jgi:hypothetical protein